MKICSTCINCEDLQYADREQVTLYCHQGNMVAEDEFAKECECFEEVEDKCQEK